jgi:hypothetical protein
VITVIKYRCTGITHLGDTDTVQSETYVITVIEYRYHSSCTLSQLSPMSLTTVSVSPR